MSLPFNNKHKNLLNWHSNYQSHKLNFRQTLSTAMQTFVHHFETRCAPVIWREIWLVVSRETVYITCHNKAMCLTWTVKLCYAKVLFVRISKLIITSWDQKKKNVHMTSNDCTIFSLAHLKLPKANKASFEQIHQLMFTSFLMVCHYISW